MPKHTKQTSKVTERDTKSEILTAYQELLDQVNKETPEDYTSKQEQAVLDTAAKETVEKITTDLSQLRVTANQTISSLTEKLTDEAERFAILQKAIAVAQKELSEMQQIKARAGMLQQMVEAQKHGEAAFEQEMASKRAVWVDEQKAYEERVQRERRREEEEYAYEQKLKRKRDADVWEEEKRERMKTLAKEQEVLTEQLEELESLREQAAQFPMQLEKAVKEAVDKALIQERKEAQVQANFVKQEADTKAQLAAVRIASLEKTVKEQDEEITELKRQLETANRQVKDIAVAVIEGPKRGKEFDESKPPQAPKP